MSYRSGYGGGFPSKKPMPTGTTSKGYSMNAVPPPSSLANMRGKFQKANTESPNNAPLAGLANTGLSKHGYSTIDAISQFASSSHSLGKRKTKTEDE